MREGDFSEKRKERRRGGDVSNHSRCSFFTVSELMAG